MQEENSNLKEKDVPKEELDSEVGNLEGEVPKEVLDNEVGNLGGEVPKEVLDSEVESLKQQLEEAKDKYLRLFAEFDNYKKRVMRERLELIKSASQDAILALLPVLDDFERAKKASEIENSNEHFSEGVSLVYHKLNNILMGMGLKVIETDGQDFNPEIHEAISEIAISEEMKGKIIETVERGYKLHDKIIRFPKVVVGK